MKKSSNQLALLGICTALSMVLSYLEFLIPPIFPSIPGIKMGLTNIVIIFLLYNLGFKSAFLVSIVRVFAVSLLFGNVMTLIYSLAGAILSLVVMSVMKKLNLFSCVGVSVCGGIVHNLAQILVAMIMLENAVIGYYMITLAVTGTISGVVIGIISSKIIEKIHYNNIF